MSSVVEIGGFWGWVALAGPLVVLTAALMMAMFWPYRADTTEYRQGVHESVAGPGAARATSSESGISNSKDPHTGNEAHRRGVGPPEAVKLFTPPVTITEAPAETEASDIDVSLRGPTQPTARDAPSSATESAAARALIDEALRERAAGHEDAAAECLRGAIMLASKAGDRTLHAAARLELGDIAQAEGDLQTACEHWQMARSLFQDEKRAKEAANCEDRMSRNRCPTDWVLTDF